MLRELVWTDISEVLRLTFDRIEALKLNCEAWAADGVIPFDRRVAVQLAMDEAEQAEDAAERLIRAVSIDTATHQRGVNEHALSTRHILPRSNAKTQKSLCSAVDGLDEVKALAARFDALLCSVILYSNYRAHSCEEKFSYFDSMTFHDVASDLKCATKL